MNKIGYAERPGKVMKKKQGFTHEPQNSPNKDWYTPPEVFEMLRFPEFDLDPCSPGKSKVPWIPAKEHYTENGLLKPWHGRVWLNPPYGQETETWLGKLALHGNGIALVFARTDPIWFHTIACKADAVCFLPGRLSFIDEKGKRQGNSGCGSMLLAWGDECADILVGSGAGWCIDNRKSQRKGLHQKIEEAKKAVRADFDFVTHDRHGQEMMLKTFMDYLNYIED